MWSKELRRVQRSHLALMISYIFAPQEFASTSASTSNSPGAGEDDVIGDCPAQTLTGAVGPDGRSRSSKTTTGGIKLMLTEAPRFAQTTFGTPTRRLHASEFAVSNKTFDAELLRRVSVPF